jgi:coenzyme Q-binding protein COQ10
MNFPPGQVFAVVADVAKYKEFIPLVERSSVRNSKPGAVGCQSFSADLVVAFKKLGIEEEFASQVETNLPKLSIVTVSAGNALKMLNSTWQITKVSEASCDITFTVDYELKNPMMQMMLGGMFGSAVQKIMAAFEGRVASLYGS